METEVTNLFNSRQVKVTITNVKPHCRWKLYSRVQDIPNAIRIIQEDKSLSLNYKFLIYVDYPSNTFTLHKK